MENLSLFPGGRYFASARRAVSVEAEDRKRKERPPKDARKKEKRHRHGGRKGTRGSAARSRSRDERP